MTLNIWNYTPPWRERRTLIAESIACHQPDVVFLQEVRHDFRYERGRGQGEQLADEIGYHATSALAQVYVPLPRVDEGLTILTRRQPLATAVCRFRRFPHQRHDENQRICLGATVECDGVEVDVYNTHFSLSPVAQAGNAVDVMRFIDERSGSGPAILGGDLNAEPNAEPVTILTGAAGETTPLTDVWASLRPEAPGFTYASKGPVRRIDYLLARNTGKFMSVELIGEEPSAAGLYAADHRGILAEIEVTEKAHPLS